MQLLKTIVQKVDTAVWIWYELLFDLVFFTEKYQMTYQIRGVFLFSKEKMLPFQGLFSALIMQ